MKNRPLIIDVYEFLKTKPLFCTKCENFTHTATEYCEHCGSRYSLRKAKASDVRKYNKAKTITPPKSTLDVSQLETQQHSPLLFSSENEIKSFLSNQRYFCEYCRRFTVRNQGYCENCGTQHSLRKAKKNDIEKYNKTRKVQQDEYNKIRQYKQIQSKVEKKPSKSIPEVSHLKLKELKPIPETTVIKESIAQDDKISHSGEITNLCPNCGHKIIDLKNRFCVNCGVQLKKSQKWFLRLLFPPESEQEEIVEPITIDKKEEKPKVVSTPQEQETPLTTEEKQPKSYEEPVTKVPQVKPEELKPIPTIPEKKEEKPKETHTICRFCGLKLELMEKFCYQCGTIIKYN